MVKVSGEFHVRLRGTQNQTQISINESGFSGIGVGATTDMFFGYKGFLKTDGTQVYRWFQTNSTVS